MEGARNRPSIFVFIQKRGCYDVNKINLFYHKGVLDKIHDKLFGKNGLYNLTKNSDLNQASKANDMSLIFTGIMRYLSYLYEEKNKNFKYAQQWKNELLNYFTEAQIKQVREKYKNKIGMLLEAKGLNNSFQKGNFGEQFVQDIFNIWARTFKKEKQVASRWGNEKVNLYKELRQTISQGNEEVIKEVTKQPNNTFEQSVDGKTDIRLKINFRSKTAANFAQFFNGLDAVNISAKNYCDSTIKIGDTSYPRAITSVLSKLKQTYDMAAVTHTSPKLWIDEVLEQQVAAYDNPESNLHMRHMKAVYELYGTGQVYYLSKEKKLVDIGEVDFIIAIDRTAKIVRVVTPNEILVNLFNTDPTFEILGMSSNSQEINLE